MLDIGVGEQQKLRIEARGITNARCDGPQFAGPARRTGSRGDDVRMSSGAAERAAAAVPSSLSSSTRTMWNSPPYCCFAREAMARPTTSASLRAGTTATTRGGAVGSAGGGSTRMRQKPPRPRSTNSQIATTAGAKDHESPLWHDVVTLRPLADCAFLRAWCVLAAWGRDSLAGLLFAGACFAQSWEIGGVAGYGWYRDVRVNGAGTEATVGIRNRFVGRRGNYGGPVRPFLGRDPVRVP